jgi:hypothetical protein
MDKKELAIIPINELQVMAQAACKSGLFQMPSPEAALTLMLLCQAEGLHPIQALRQYHIIKGRPAMRADAMQAAFQIAGGKIQWIERGDKSCAAEFSHPAGGTCVVTWSIEMAKQAGLTANPTWQKFPRAMLSARVVSEGIRAVYPAVVCGLYTPEEVQDFDDQPKTKKRGRQDVKNEPEDVIPVAATESTTAPAEMPSVESVTIADKTIGKYKPADEFIPEPGIVELMPPIKAATRPAKADKPAGDVAAEIKLIRSLAQKYGCKTVEQFKECMQIAAGRAVEAASALGDDERKKAIEFLTEATKGN